MATQADEMKKRIKILGIPVDIIPENCFEEIIKNLLQDAEKHQIVFLRTLDLMRARRNSTYADCVLKASLVVPVSRGLIRGASFLKRDPVIRYMPFEFVIRLLGILEQRNDSVYLIGQKPRSLQVISGNLRTSFPGLRQVGRYAGFFKKEVENNILLAIRKASPTLLLAGEGIPGKDLWMQRQSEQLNPGLYLWSGECFAIFSGKKERPSRKQWERGVDTLPETIRRPWRFLRVFIYLYFLLLLALHRIRGK